METPIYIGIECVKMDKMNQYNRSYLVESPEGTNFKPARRYLEKEFGIQYNEAMQLFGKLKNEFNGVRGLDSKYMLGLVRMYKNGELEGTIGEEPNEKSIATLVNQALTLATEEPYASKLDQDLNGMTAMQFIEAFQDKVETAGEADKENLSKQDFGGNKGYDIVLIDSFEKASEYAKYTTWCVTQSESAYNNYTKGGTFYFCLKGGFENIPKEVGANAPLDEYGLSMIAVSIYPDGSCNTITCRWNNSNGGNDKVMTTEELSKVIGENFYDVFKPVKRTITLGGREYVPGFKDGKNNALYDEQGKNVLGVDAEDFYVDEWFTKLLGCDVLGVKVQYCVNFLKFQDGKTQYLFDEWVEWYEYYSDLSQQLGAHSFKLGVDYKENYATLRDGKAQYLFDEWLDNSYYDNYLSQELGVPCFNIDIIEKENYAIFKGGGIEYLFDEWYNRCFFHMQINRYFGVIFFYVEKDGLWNCIKYQDGKTEYLFNEWVNNRVDLDAPVDKYLIRRNENRMQHISKIITEMVIRKLSWE